MILRRLENENYRTAFYIVCGVIMLLLIVLGVIASTEKEETPYEQETREKIKCEKCSIDFPNKEEAQIHANEDNHIVKKLFQKKERRCNDCSFATHDGKIMQEHENFFNHVSRVFWKIYSTAWIHPDLEIQKAIDLIMEQFRGKVTRQEVFPKLMELARVDTKRSMAQRGEEEGMSSVEYSMQFVSARELSMIPFPPLRTSAPL